MKWINVNKELPDEYVTGLGEIPVVICIDRDPHDGDVHDSVRYQISLGHSNPSCGWTDIDGSDVYVTHWAYLPNLPDSVS